MGYYPASHLLRGLFVDDLFRVHSIRKRTRSHGRNHFFFLTLASGAGSCDAIAGKAAVGLTLVQIIHVCGCVLVRRREPILVLCSLKPINSQDHILRHSSSHGGKARFSRSAGSAHRLHPCMRREPQ